MAAGDFRGSYVPEEKIFNAIIPRSLYLGHECILSDHPKPFFEIWSFL